ncbi:MAG: glucose-1-phosphate adenylyltransferase subunit GlgD [Eubacteriales bacterium]|nr:glucose-1-phosphate adenylyltransferase subunit GlgD [Eubacteriales bacterium]
MYKAFGIINASRKNAYVEGLQEFRPIGAFSFLGRYRVIDFPISNMSNSNIDRIQIYINSTPRSLVEHLGTGRHYNINSKKGKLQMLFANTVNRNDIYNTDISYYYDNLESIKTMEHEYVVIAPCYMIYTADFSELLQNHIDSKADITLLYHSVDNAKDEYLKCDTLNLNPQKGVKSIEPNRGTSKNKHIFMDTYIMKRNLFMELIEKARATSSMYTLSDIVNGMCVEDNFNIRGIAHKGFFAAITDFTSFVHANKALIDYKAAQELFHEDWPIYTRTNDSSPTQYFDTAQVKNSVVSNGCKIKGTVENSIVGRGVTIEEGAVVKDSLVFSQSYIGKDVHIENVIVDKLANISKVKEIIATPEQPGYVKRHDSI